MVEAAPANADDTPDTPTTPRRPPVGVAAAAAAIGISVSSVQRRIDAWQRGDRSDYALQGGRAGKCRYADPDDVDALAGQLRGTVPPGRHARETAEG